jgi:hypothetical protein
MEERAALAARFGHDQVVERQVVRNDQVLFDVPARTRPAAEAPINSLLIATPMLSPTSDAAPARRSQRQAITFRITYSQGTRLLTGGTRLLAGYSTTHRGYYSQGTRRLQAGRRTASCRC